MSRVVPPALYRPQMIGRPTSLRQRGASGREGLAAGPPTVHLAAVEAAVTVPRMTSNRPRAASTATEHVRVLRVPIGLPPFPRRSCAVRRHPNARPTGVSDVSPGRLPSFYCRGAGVAPPRLRHRAWIRGRGRRARRRAMRRAARTARRRAGPQCSGSVSPAAK
jgi:hypothetical protein